MKLECNVLSIKKGNKHKTRRYLILYALCKPKPQPSYGHTNTGKILIGSVARCTRFFAEIICELS